MAAVAAFAMSFAATTAVVAAPASAEPVGIVVNARMTSSAGQVDAGDEVSVEVTLANVGSTAQRVLLDEVVGDLLDDARLSDLPRSSDPSVTVARLGHDRFALTGRLGRGERVTIGYSVVVLPSAERGDGILGRAAVPADDVVECDSVAAPSEVGALGRCSAIVLPGAHRASAASSVGEVHVADGVAPATAGAAEAAGVLAASGAEPTVEVEALIESRPFTAATSAGVVAAALVALAGFVVAVRLRRVRTARWPRSGHGSTGRATWSVEPARSTRPSPRAERARSSSTVHSPWGVPSSAVSSPAEPPVDRAGPSVERRDPAPVVGSRRERRLADQRLAERGLTLPVA
jgi:hypothetical protein